MDIQILAQKFFDYCIYIRGYSKKTIKKYKYSIDTYCKFANIQTIDQVSNENARALFVYGRGERNWKATTFLLIRASLLVFFRWCQKEGVITQNPVEDIETPKLPSVIPAWLNREDALKLLEIVYNYPYDYKFVRYRNHAIFAMFIFAGLRLNELLNLRFADVDIENMTIMVRQGKGNKDRSVPMSYTLAQILKRYVVERKRLNKTCIQFFASSNRNCGFTEDGLRHVVKLIRTASGIPFSIHKLRHTFATLMSQGGCEIVSLQHMLGHNNIQTTMRYVHADATRFRLQIGKHPLNDLVR